MELLHTKLRFAVDDVYKLGGGGGQTKAVASSKSQNKLGEGAWGTSKFRCHLCNVYMCV